MTSNQDQSEKKERKLGIWEKYLTLWVAVCVNRQRNWATSVKSDNGHLGLAPAPPKK